MPQLPRTIRICGHGMTALRNYKGTKTASDLMSEALERALTSASMKLRDLDGLIAVPSLSHPHIMEAHFLATKVGLLPSENFLVRTIDTGGAGPVSGLLEAKRMIENENCEAVAVVAGDAVSSLTTEDFLKRADAGIGGGGLPSPVIPHGYSRVTEWHMDRYNLSRSQLAKVSVLMSHQASRHEHAAHGAAKRHTLEEVMSSKRITPQLNLLECARRLDGAASIIVASSRYLKRKGLLDRGNGDVVVLAGGEASGPLFPPPIIDETMFSCERAARNAYSEAQVRPAEIDYFGLYDCFPICFLRAVEAVGIAPKGKGGEWIDLEYEKLLADEENYFLNVNTHGGLLSFGAPWEAPAMFSIIEAVRQLTGIAKKQQVGDINRALVYGNGGIFSSSAVVILSKALTAEAKL